eukprot:SAG22_NODE_336_length_12071_cov_10.875125_5_plen_74_part_00
MIQHDVCGAPSISNFLLPFCDTKSTLNVADVSRFCIIAVTSTTFAGLTSFWETWQHWRCAPLMPKDPSSSWSV